MLLSIVMMVKNEERYLDKTLYALNELRKDIDTELIILDTGSTDSTVEIAKKYTDKVYFSKWNDNFADMRNISISYASGDWILILDADEKLTNYINSLKNATTESQISDIYKSIQKYVNENALFMSLVIRYDYIVTNRRIEGKISPNSFDIYEGITNLDIAK